MSASGSLDTQGSLQGQRYAFYFQWQGAREFFYRKELFYNRKERRGRKGFHKACPVAPLGGWGALRPLCSLRLKNKTSSWRFSTSYRKPTKKL